MNQMTAENLPISADLLEILRDPYAVQHPELYGDDPGQLELVHNSWLVSKDTGYKYPIKDGIPVMLVEEGERWKDTPVEQLPVPPHFEAGASSSATPMEPIMDATNGSNKLVLGLVVGITLFFVIILLRKRAKVE